MFYDKDRQLVVNLDYQLVKKKLAFILTKTLFICSHSSNCDLSWDSLQHNIMHNIIALTNNSLFLCNLKPTNKHDCVSLM